MTTKFTLTVKDSNFNSKEPKLPEWYQPIYDHWIENYIADFIEKYGRKPFADELPGRHRVLESIDAQTDADGDDLGDSSHLEEELSVFEDDDTPDHILRLREIVADMPDQWQRVYQLVNREGFNKTQAAKILGISDVRVGQLIKKINEKIASDKELKKYFR